MIDKQVDFDGLIQKPPNQWDCGYIKLILNDSPVY